MTRSKDQNRCHAAETLKNQLRSRKVSWNSQGTLPWSATSLDAISHLRAIRDSFVPKPPLYELLLIDVVEAELGRVTIAISPDESFVSPAGRVGGGIVVSALDTCLAWACDTRAPLEHACTTIEIKTNFLRAIPTTVPRLLIKSECIFWGSRILVANGEALDTTGRVCAIATATCLAVPKDQYGRLHQADS